MALDYLKQGCDELIDMDEIKKLLTRLERADKLLQKISTSKKKSKTTDNINNIETCHII